MLVSQLIERLEKLQQETGGDLEVMILDGINGGGYPRTINSGPRLHQVTQEDADECADCEDLVGEPVIEMGYGCY